jgi:DNA repair exonuclease SbcCD ATPase subunit
LIQEVDNAFQAVRPIFPNLPRAKNRPDEHLKAESNQSDKKIQRLESVNLTSVSSWPQEEQKNNFTASDCPISEDGGDRNKLSRLARDLAQKQEEAKLYTKEIRILKRQVQLLLAHSDEMADLKIDLGDVRAQNEELQRQINEPRGSTRRASKVQNEDFEELQAQARTIQQLKSRLDKASQMNELIYKPSLYCWARKPADSKGGLMKIRTSVILLASSLEEILLTPKDLERSLELHGNGQATMDLLKKSFGNIQLLFTEPWLALRSLLFRFIRDYIFYSDLWQTLHCDGFIAREYQRVIGLSGRLY